MEYRNTRYSFSLPESWKGYQVRWSEWGGGVLSDDGSVALEFRGPELRIRHSKWTQESPREDMPIMIFTIAQWNEHPIVSAAPFDPAELGRNEKYVLLSGLRKNDSLLDPGIASAIERTQGVKQEGVRAGRLKEQTNKLLNAPDPSTIWQRLSRSMQTRLPNTPAIRTTGRNNPKNHGSGNPGCRGGGGLTLADDESYLTTAF